MLVAAERRMSFIGQHENCSWVSQTSSGSLEAVVTSMLP
jgi:hypothetical protein